MKEEIKIFENNKLIILYPSGIIINYSIDDLTIEKNKVKDCIAMLKSIELDIDSLIQGIILKQKKIKTEEFV